MSRKTLCSGKIIHILLFWNLRTFSYKATDQYYGTDTENTAGIAALLKMF